MTDQTKGNFRINLNRNKQAGDNQPMFDRGIISTPQDPDTKFELKLWAYKDKHGRTFFAGPSSHVAVTATALERADLLMEESARSFDSAAVSPEGTGLVQLAPNQVILFSNGYKLKGDGAKALDKAERSVNEKRPDLWGFWNPGDGQAQLRVAAWDMEGRYGPYLAGSTQVPMPGKSLDTQTAASELAETPRRGRGSR